MVGLNVSVGAARPLALLLMVPLALSACASDTQAGDGAGGGDGVAGQVPAPATTGTAPGMPIGAQPGAPATPTLPAAPGSATPGAPDTTPATAAVPPGATPEATPPAGDGPVAGNTAPPPSTGSSCLQGGGDYLAKGPYGTGSMDVSIGSSGMFTIFYPQPLETDCAHPIVAWGNGTGVTGSATYGFYNEHAASWGIVVVASHESNVGSGDFHKAGLDYLLAENDNPSSMFHQKLSTRAGTSGHSQGGMGANVGAGHPNVEAEVNVQGAFGSAPTGVSFLCLTGTADINPTGCASAVRGSASPALYANWEGADHTGTATIAGFITGDAGTMQYMRLYSAWFRCFLADDSAACALFEGPTCSVCSEPGWAEIETVNY